MLPMTPRTPSPPSNMEVETLCFGVFFCLKCKSIYNFFEIGFLDFFFVVVILSLTVKINIKIID